MPAKKSQKSAPKTVKRGAKKPAAKAGSGVSAVTPMPARPSVRDRAVMAALDLAAERGWADVGLTDIAERAGISLSELRDHCDDRDDILVAYGRMVDRIVLDRFPPGTYGDDVPHRDRLFDVLMERFDVLNDNRAAVLSIVDALRHDPKQAVVGLPHLGRSMMWMMETVGIDLTGWAGALKVAGVTGVYLYAARAWTDDDSVDLSRTMAALDRGLSRMDSIAEKVF